MIISIVNIIHNPNSQISEYIPSCIYIGSTLISFLVPFIFLISFLKDLFFFIFPFSKFLLENENTQHF